MTKSSEIIPIEKIQNSIYLIRGQKVMLDRDLAKLYGVQTRALVQAGKYQESSCPEFIKIPEKISHDPLFCGTPKRFVSGRILPF